MRGANPRRSHHIRVFYGLRNWVGRVPNDFRFTYRGPDGADYLA